MRKDRKQREKEEEEIEREINATRRNGAKQDADNPKNLTRPPADTRPTRDNEQMETTEGQNLEQAQAEETEENKDDRNL